MRLKLLRARTTVTIDFGTRSSESVFCLFNLDASMPLELCGEYQPFEMDCNIDLELWTALGTMSQAVEFELVSVARVCSLDGSTSSSRLV